MMRTKSKILCLVVIAILCQSFRDTNIDHDNTSKELKQGDIRNEYQKTNNLKVNVPKKPSTDMKATIPELYNKVTYEQFVREFLSSSESETLKRLKLSFETIETDIMMCESFRNIKKFRSVLEERLMQYMNYHELGNESMIEIFGNTFTDSLNFYLFEYDNEIEGATLYLNNEEFLKKTGLTQGDADNNFFKVMIEYIGNYEGVYNRNIYEYDGGDMSYSLLGDGTYTAILKALSESEKSTVFKIENNEIRAEVFESLNVEYFALSKDKVMLEIDSLLNVYPEVEQLKSLKLRCSINDSGIKFNCIETGCYD